MRDGKDLELIRLRLVDDVKGKTAQAEASNVAAECTASTWVDGQEPLHMLYFVEEFAAEP